MDFIFLYEFPKVLKNDLQSDIQLIDVIKIQHISIFMDLMRAAKRKIANCF